MGVTDFAKVTGFAEVTGSGAAARTCRVVIFGGNSSGKLYDHTVAGPAVERHSKTCAAERVGFSMVADSPLPDASFSSEVCAQPVNAKISTPSTRAFTRAFDVMWLSYLQSCQGQHRQLPDSSHSYSVLQTGVEN